MLRTVRRIEKPWGYELVFAHTDRYVGKILHVNPGEALSLQYHERKDETLYLAAGSVELQVQEDQVQEDQVQEDDDERGAREDRHEGNGALVSRWLLLGEAYHIPSFTRHRMVAGPEGCDLVEVSTPELDDVVRLEDRYGRV